MSAHDLGTWAVRVDLCDGCGFTYPWEAGTDWDSEEELLHSIQWMFTEGNYGCDCNKRLFLARYSNCEEPEEDPPCGDVLKLKRLTAMAPDGREFELELQL